MIALGHETKHLSSVQERRPWRDAHPAGQAEDRRHVWLVGAARAKQDPSRDAARREAAGHNQGARLHRPDPDGGEDGETGVL